MKYSHRTLALTLAALVTLGVTASGCANPWFGSTPQKTQNDASAASSGRDPKQAAVTYITGLCKLPKEERDAKVRELNEALLPNHANISCGRGGDEL
jgi:hypothetical protein